MEKVRFSFIGLLNSRSETVSLEFICILSNKVLNVEPAADVTSLSQVVFSVKYLYSTLSFCCHSVLFPDIWTNKMGLGVNIHTLKFSCVQIVSAKGLAAFCYQTIQTEKTGCGIWIKHASFKYANAKTCKSCSFTRETHLSALV